MDIVMLAAGTSSRMGRENKLLLQYDEVPLVTHCCLQALRFLENHSVANNENGTLIVVTGYRRRSVEKALAQCKLFVERTDTPISMLIVNNPDYRNGQFTSTKVGVREVSEGSEFFISLADMPLVTAEHYAKLVPMLQGHDAVRPFFKNKEDRVPGHPVLHAFCLKDRIVQCPNDWSVSRILKSADVFEPSFDDSSWSQDIDIPQDYQNLRG